MKWLLVLMALFTAAASAADISGKWKATADMGQGPMERTFVFKQDGTNLTGETESQMMGKSALTNGKVEGDTVTFTIEINFGDQPMKMNYKGKITGDQIKFTVQSPMPDSPPIEWNAKKVS